MLRARHAVSQFHESVVSRLCRGCGYALKDRFEIGSLPLSNRYFSQPTSDTRYPFILAECAHCGLMQNAAAPPLTDVRPRSSKLRYNEREDHLPELSAQLLSDFPALRTLSGFGPFDDPLLKQLAERGLQTRTTDLLATANQNPPPTGYYYIESMHDLADGPIGNVVLTDLEPADAIVYRYLLEHSPQPAQTLRRLASLVRPGGYLIIEVPDSSSWLKRADAAFLWEEHLSYFTAAALKNIATHAGFRVCASYHYAHVYEDALVMVLRATDALPPLLPPREQLLPSFRTAFTADKQRFREYVAALRATPAKIALVGIGHQAMFFIHAYGAELAFDYLIDDDAQKGGRFISDVPVPIIASTDPAVIAGTELLLLAVRPDREDAAAEKFRRMLPETAAVQSIFRGGKRALLDSVLCK